MSLKIPPPSPVLNAMQCLLTICIALRFYCSAVGHLLQVLFYDVVYLSIATLDYLLHTMFLHCSAIVAKCPAMAKAIYCMCSPPTHPPTPCYATATPLPSFRFTALQCNSIVPPIENLRTVLICHLLTVAIGIALNGIAHTLPFGLECCCALCYTS